MNKPVEPIDSSADESLSPTAPIADATGMTAQPTSSGESKIPPLAVFRFEERGSGTKGYGDKIGDFLVASLAENPELIVLERAELKKTLDEQKLNLSGLVKPEEATQVGRLTGAKIFISGSIVELDSTLILSARITSTETGRIIGAKVKGKTNDDLADLAEKLAGEGGQTFHVAPLAFGVERIER